MNQLMTLDDVFLQASRQANGIDHLGIAYHIKGLIPSGALVAIRPAPDVDATSFTIGLAFTMTQEGAVLGTHRCEMDCNVMYCEGSLGGEQLSALMEEFRPKEEQCKLYGIPLVSIQACGNFTRFPSLFTASLRDYVGKYMREWDCGAIVVNNTSSWFQPPKKNFQAELKRVRSWMYDLKHAMITQVYVVPSGKHPFQIDPTIVDVSLEISRVERHGREIIQVKAQGTAVSQTFQDPLLLEVETENGVKRMRDYYDLERKRRFAIQLAASGIKQGEIANLVRRHQATISRWLKNAEEEGLIERSGHRVRLSERGNKMLGQ